MRIRKIRKISTLSQKKYVFSSPYLEMLIEMLVKLQDGSHIPTSVTVVRGTPHSHLSCYVVSCHVMSFYVMWEILKFMPFIHILMNINNEWDDGE